MKLIIRIPNNNIPERKYIIYVLINQFLKLSPNISIDTNITDTEIIVNNSKIIFKDYFFSNNPEKLSYLKFENIPKNLSFLKTNKFSEQINIPIIYGKDFISEKNNEIICHIDIFASSFFMLTRWEEILLSKDKYSRCDENEMLVIKQDIYNRPIVNEYTELLRGMIEYISKQTIPITQEYKLKITHDVDAIYRYDSIKKYIKAIAGDILYRKNPFLVFKTTYDFIKSSINKKNDPYNTFDFLINTSNEFNLKSHFYFIPSNLGELDARYTLQSNKVNKIIEHIKNKKHIVGLHGSWNGYNNDEIFENELHRFKPHEIYEGRQHYLRFENPKTWQIWENNNLKIDSTLGFSAKNGFRCGTCYEFRVFDVINRKILNLIEQPLIFMDTASVQTNTYSVKAISDELKNLSSIVKKYKGTFIFLWHPNNLNNEWQELAKNYKMFIKTII